MELKQRPLIITSIGVIVHMLFGLVIASIGILFLIVEQTLSSLIPVIIGISFIIIPLLVIILQFRTLTIKNNDLYIKIGFISKSFHIRDIEEIQNIAWVGFGELEKKDSKWITLKAIVNGKKKNLLTITTKNNKAELERLVARLKSVNGNLKINEMKKSPYWQSTQWYEFQEYSDDIK